MNLDALPRENKWTNDKGEEVTTYFCLIEGVEVPCYDAAGKDLKPGPLPEGWEVKTSQKGKKYLATPRKQGGGGRQFVVAWSNTAEGSHFQAERSDRRTALMQAVEANPGVGGKVLLEKASEFYLWLRETSPVLPMSVEPSLSSGRAGDSSSAPTSLAHGEGAVAPAADTQGAGKPTTTPSQGEEPQQGNPASCTHPEEGLTNKKPDGRPLPQGRLLCTGCRMVLTTEGAA